eukprot:2120240-Amphidinium_carterae.1
MTTLDGLTFTPNAVNDNSRLDAIVAKLMEWQLLMGRLCCQDFGMTTLDGKPLLPRLWNDNFGWDVTVA